MTTILPMRFSRASLAELPSRIRVSCDEVELPEWQILSDPVELEFNPDDLTSTIPMAPYQRKGSAAALIRQGSAAASSMSATASLAFTSSMPMPRLSSTYESELLRLPLPENEHGHRLGDLKFVRGGGNKAWLFLWSPPAESRGMPLEEFEQFLCDVVDHPDVWRCRGPHGSMVLKRQG